MNIIYIHRTRGRGVEGVHINEIVHQFEKAGHQVNIIAPVEPQPKVDGTDNSAEKFSFSNKLPEFIFELFELAYNFIGYRKLRRLNNVVDADLIYERYAIFNLFGIYFGMSRGIATVIEANYTADLPLVRKRTAILKPFAKWMDKYIFRNADRVIAVSSYVKQHLIESYGVEADKIIVLPNAADPDKFAFVNYEPITAVKTIGFVGGFYPWHGLPLLLSAFAELLREFPDTHLCLVGDGPEKENIEALADKLGIAAKVKFTGQVKHDQLADIISSFYVGVMPDSNMYGSPMKIFEYMSMGVPVIAPNYPPILDAIENGKQGLIFKRLSCDDLVNCLSEVLRSDELRHRLSISARQEIETERNWKNNALRSVEGLSRV